MTTAAPASTPASAAASAPARAVVVGGLVVSVLAAIFSAVLELYFTQVRIDGFPIGVSILGAVVANLAISWFVVTTTGRRRSLVAPWAVWTVIMFFAAGVRTREGDYLLTGNDYVALVMILVGSLTFAIYTYRLILRIPPPRT